MDEENGFRPRQDPRTLDVPGCGGRIWPPPDSPWTRFFSSPVQTSTKSAGPQTALGWVLNLRSWEEVLCCADMSTDSGRQVPADPAQHSP